MAELRRTETGVNHAVEALSDLQNSSIQTLGDCAKFREVEDKVVNEWTAKLRRFVAQCTQVDPVSEKPIYGPKTQARIKAASSTLEAVLELVRMLEPMVAAKEKELMDEAERLAAEKARAVRKAEEQRRAAEYDAKLRAEREEKERKIREEREFKERLVSAGDTVRQLEEQHVDPWVLALREEKAKILKVFPVGQQGVEQSVDMIRSFTEGSSQQTMYRNAVGLLVMYLKNIVAHPDNEMFRAIKVENTHFKEKLAPLEGTRECLLALGFKLVNREEDVVYFLEEPNLEQDLDKWSNWYEEVKALLGVLEGFE